MVMMVSPFASLRVPHGSVQKPSIKIIPHHLDHHPELTSPAQKPSKTTLWKRFSERPLQSYVLKAIQSTSRRLLDSFVDSVFQFVDQPLLHSQRNFAPVEEIGEEVQVICNEGEIRPNFPQGVFIRNGPNPLFGGLKSTESVFGRSSQTWVEGEGMLHAVYFKKSPLGDDWILSYRNRYVYSETFKLEKPRRRPAFLPAVEGDSWAILAAYFLNFFRFGTVNKYMNNTDVFEHSGKVYVIAENYVPQEVDIHTLETYGIWDLNGAWNQPFTSHPKRALQSGELVTMGINAKRPYYIVGVISADGKKLIHKVDLGFDRSILSHEIGVTQSYNVIMDHPLVFDLNRLVNGGPLLKYDESGYARIGVMPRYGDMSSVRWFDVESNCTFHIFNCYEEGNEVVVRGCRSLTSLFPDPDWGSNKLEWFSRGFNFTEKSNINAVDNNTSHQGYLFSRAYEWILNMETGRVTELNLTGTDFSVDFPFINANFTGLMNKSGYAQVIDSKASSVSGMAKYGGLAKLHFDKPCLESELFKRDAESNARMVKIEYPHLEENSFCSGSVFIPKISDSNAEEDEDNGWILSFVHNEETETSQVHIIDSRTFEGDVVARIDLPQRVPYGFHGTFVAI